LALFASTNAKPVQVNAVEPKKKQRQKRMEAGERQQRFSKLKDIRKEILQVEKELQTKSEERKTLRPISL